MSNENPKWMPKQRFWTDGERDRLVREHGEMAALLERMLVFCEAVESRTGRRMEEGNLARALLAKIKKGA